MFNDIIELESFGETDIYEKLTVINKISDNPDYLDYTCLNIENKNVVVRHNFQTNKIWIVPTMSENVNKFPISNTNDRWVVLIDLNN